MKQTGTAICFALVVAASAGQVRADGAFPNSQSILLPASRPSEILLVTNFGIVSSQDDGRTWLWSCEQDENAFGVLYQMGGAPRNRIYALANQQVVFSDDGTCGWHVAGGAVADQAVTDYFIDPSNPARAVAVGARDGNYVVLESTDAGETFNTVLYTALPNDWITGVEIARSDPKTIYLALSSVNGGAVSLGRSLDGGASWTISNLTTRLGSGGTLKIISVDPQDAQRVLLLLVNPSGQSILLTTDGGATLNASLVLQAVFSTFARLQNGTLLLSGIAASTPLLYRSRDRGVSFRSLPNAPDLFAMAERAGRVYGATNHMTTGYPMATSDDEGDTWKKFMAFTDVKATLPCVKGVCQSSCQAEVMLSVWPEDVCTADPPDGGMSGGAGGRGADGGAGSSGTGGHGGDSGAGTSGTGGSASGCGCDVAPSGKSLPGLVAAALLWLVAAVGRRRRQSGGRARPVRH